MKQSLSLTFESPVTPIGVSAPLASLPGLEGTVATAFYLNQKTANHEAARALVRGTLGAIAGDIVSLGQKMASKGQRAYMPGIVRDETELSRLLGYRAQIPTEDQPGADQTERIRYIWKGNSTFAEAMLGDGSFTMSSTGIYVPSVELGDDSVVFGETHAQLHVGVKSGVVAAVLLPISSEADSELRIAGPLKQIVAMAALDAYAQKLVQRGETLLAPEYRFSRWNQLSSTDENRVGDKGFRSYATTVRFEKSDE